MSKRKQKQPKLTSKQNKYLKGLGHHLSPLAMIGREGISKSLVTAVNDVLKAHELVKMKVQNNCPIDRKEVAVNIGEATGSAVVQILGKTILLYHENADLDPEKKIVLP